MQRYSLWGIYSRHYAGIDRRSLAVLLWIKRSHVKTACEPEKATNDARWVRFGLLPETGSVVRASHEPCLSPTSADYTRGQATFAPLRAVAGTQVPSLLGLPDCTRHLPVAPYRIAPAADTSIAA